MTDYSHLLESLVSTHSVADLRAAALESFDLDLLGVYCLHTGRQVGTFDEAVIQFAMEEEAADDTETLIDGLVTRVVASMRPSPMLNKPDRVTLANLASKYPVDILCYLANRLHSDRGLATHRDGAVLAPYIARIAMHKQWTELALKGVDTRPWIHWLLELDAKRNLHDETPPLVTVGHFPRPLMTQVTPDNAAEMLKLFEAWAFESLKEYDNRDRVATAQANWMRGNTLAGRAYAESWVANPETVERKLEFGRTKRPLKDSFKGQRPASNKPATKLDIRVNQFIGLLEGVLNGEVKPTQPKPVSKVRTGAMLFKKKES